MKTPKSKAKPAKAPDAQAVAEKRARWALNLVAKMAQEVEEEVEDFRAEFIERPHKELREAMLARPNVFQLAQLAAQLARREDFQDDKAKDVALRARELWGACADVITEELNRIRAAVPKILEERLEERSNAKTPQEREVRNAVSEGKFPMPFEDALKIIAGRKLHLADRHKAFRDFLRDGYAYSGRALSKSRIESSVEKVLAICKADGFSKDDLIEVSDWFSKWKEARAKAKAQKAASKRWKKKLQEPLLTGTDFAKKALSIFPPVA